MSLPSYKPTRVSVRLEASDDVVLNLVNGLSGHVYFVVRNDEDKAVTLIIPGFNKHKVTDNYTTRSFDFISALRQDVFHIQGLDFWSTNSLDGFKVADTVMSQPTHLVISPGATAKYVLLARGSREMCETGLRRGSYVLGFNDPSGKIKCKFSTLEEETYFKEKRELPVTATLYTDGQDYSALFQSTGHPIQIEVVLGVPIPRFQMSFRLSSNICNLSGSPSFFLKFIVKSLESRPVIVRMEQPWSDNHGFESIISLTDVAAGNDIELPIMNWCFDEVVNVPDERTHIKEEVDFHEGVKRTHKCKFGIADLECLQPNRTYMVKVHQISFSSWCYGELGHADYMPRWMSSDGIISPEIVEAAPTFASVVEKTIEAGSTGPFHRLPRELRDMIYKNLTATEPDVLYFRTEA